MISKKNKPVELIRMIGPWGTCKRVHPDKIDFNIQMGWKVLEPEITYESDPQKFLENMKYPDLIQFGNDKYPDLDVKHGMKKGDIISAILDKPAEPINNAPVDPPVADSNTGDDD